MYESAERNRPTADRAFVYLTLLSCVRVDAFCEGFGATCRGVNDVDETWLDTTVCKLEASKLIKGSLSANTDTNTLSCHAYHLTLAQTISREVHCPHASSTGGRKCSATPEKEDFCTQYADTCNPTSALTECKNDFDAKAVGFVGTGGGDTRACRVYHLGIAMASTEKAARDAHCGHASKSGGGVCVGGNSVGASPAQFCAQYDVGTS